MPELSRFYGIIVALFYVDHDPPHVHVSIGGTLKKAKYRATFRISNGDIIDGRLPTRARKLVEAWLVLHHDELVIAWENAKRGRAFGKIAPLK